MKRKQTITIVLLAIFTFTLFSNSVNASLVEFSQTPYPAKAGDYVTVIATINLPSGTTESVTTATMSYRVNGVSMSKKCNEALPKVGAGELTFNLGTVNKGDFIEYKVYITFYYNDLKQSEWFEIDLTEENTQPTETTTNGTEETSLQSYYVLISIVALSSILLINKRRKFKRAE